MWFAAYTLPKQEPRIGQQLADLPVDEVFLPVYQPRMGARKASVEKEGRLLFTRYVFWKTSDLTEYLLGEVRRIDGIIKVLSAPTDAPSVVDEQEINVLKALCAGESYPDLIPLPTKGHRARIRTGPLEGVTGVVLRSNPTFTVLAFTLPILAGAYELAVPTLDLVLLDTPNAGPDPDAATAPPRKTRHRAGKRARRRRDGTPPRDDSAGS